MKTYQHWINGEFTDPASGEWLDTANPYSGEVWARIPRGNAADASRAVTAAEFAMTKGPWAKMSATDRGKIMRKIGDAVAENAGALAEFEVRDCGKLLTDMQGQLKYKADYWYYYAGLADKIEGRVVPMGNPDLFAFTRREPVGVVAALTAWNSPLIFLALKCAPALAAGCAVVVKPSEYASVSSLEFAALTKKAGLPDGVINVVSGLGQDIGAALVEHPGVSKITFTGSDFTGTRIYEAAARSMKRVTLELGGKSPNIVFADADLGAAAVGAITGIFGAAGQMCTAGSRLLVQKTVMPEFIGRMLEIARGTKLGDPMKPETNVGPITTPPQFKKVMEYIELAKSEGARCILGGKPAAGPGITGGQFVEPTIFDRVTNRMRIAQEEVFGPILSVIGFEDEDEAIAIGNDTKFGLAAGVWTKDMGRAMRMSKALRAGTIWVNTYRTYNFTTPFGGMKGSGLGRENGIEAVDEYLETKCVMLSTVTDVPSNPYVIR